MRRFRQPNGASAGCDMRCISRTVATPWQWCARRRPTAWVTARPSASKGSPPGAGLRHLLAARIAKSVAGCHALEAERARHVRAMNSGASAVPGRCRCRRLHRRHALELDPQVLDAAHHTWLAVPELGCQADRGEAVEQSRKRDTRLQYRERCAQASVVDAARRTGGARARARIQRRGRSPAGRRRCPCPPA